VPFYENVFIARQDISAAQAEALADSFANILAEQGGKVTKREYWGLKNLAYRIKKNRKGHYTLFNIDAPPAAVHEMERNMRLNEDVLRYLTIKVDALEEGPSAMLQSRHRDREREGRFREREREDRQRRERQAAEPAPAAEAEGAVE
jgi:small subunit ribosomal protein S6